MAKVTDYQNNFTNGEISPRALGRFDLAKYANSVKILENFLGYQLGGAVFRPGTVFVAEIKNSANKVYLIPFQYSTIQSYVIEVGSTYMRFFANEGQLVVTSTPVEIATPYLQADIFDLHYTQDADTMYIAHAGYASRKLQRVSSTSFRMNVVKFIRGPFRDTNVGNVTLTASADTGATTVTATIPAWGTGTLYIVNDFVTNAGTSYRCVVPHTAGTFSTDLAAEYWEAEDFFKAGHVGSIWRIKSGVVRILTKTSALIVTAVVETEPNGTAGNLATSAAAQTDWAEGAFSDAQGWPTTCAFHQQRLFYAKGITFYGSVVGAYDDFSSGANDDDAVQFSLASDQVNSIRWMKSSSNALEMGTTGGTVSVSGSSSSVITPTNIQITYDTDIGCAPKMAKRISSYVLYLQSNLFNLRELTFNFYVNREVGNDMNLIADHILRDGQGAVDFDKQISPNERVWVVRDDGEMAVLVRNPEQDVMGWARIIAGETATGAGKFESVCILQKDGADDEIWVVVKRVVNGSVKRYVEYFSAEYFDNPWEPVRVDCSLSVDVPVTITGITNASVGVVTAPSHGFSNGDSVKIDIVEGMTEVNNKVFVVANKTTHTFELNDAGGDPIDTSDYGTYSEGGEVRKRFKTITGLDHLNGETVTVAVDGGVPSNQQTYLVGSVTGGIGFVLKDYAAVAHIGLPYTGFIKLLKAPSGQTKLQKIYLATLRVDKSLGVLIGQDEDHMTRIPFNTVNQPVGQCPELVSGDIQDTFDAWFDAETEVCIKQDQPLPLHILSLAFRKEINEK